MNERLFKKGDLVLHKTGGPKMVVVDYDANLEDLVICEWMNKNNDLIEKAIAETSLEKYDPNDYKIIMGPNRRDMRY